MERKWQPTPVFLPGKSHGERRLVGYSPWSCKRVRHNLATKQQLLKNSKIYESMILKKMDIVFKFMQGNYWQKNCLKGLQETVSGAHTELGILPVTTSQSGKLNDSQ